MADDMPVNDHLVNNTLSHLQRTCLDNMIGWGFFVVCLDFFVVFFFCFIAVLFCVVKKKTPVFCIGRAWATLEMEVRITAFK